MANRVTILIEGYVDGDRATGTVSLIKTAEGRVVLVDAGDPWNGEELRERLKEEGLETDEVTDVVITHGHIDHCGNVSMFKKAKFFMDGDWASDGRYDQREDRHSITPSVWIEARRGHTASDLIVVVEEEEERGGTVVVAGDLFEDGDDEEKWRGNSQYPEEHEKSREYVRQIADWIVPGHGDVFKVEKKS